MKISYAVTVCNELVEIQRLLDLLLKQKRLQDEIVVLVDNPCGEDDEMISTLYQYESHNHDHMTVWRSEFAGHFANWKNKLTGYCTGDYIFQIDADEIPSEVLIDNLPQILEENDIDVIMVPRINTVEGLTEAHVAKWHWQVNEHGWVNWPDYQWRIYRRDESITWKNPVHEVLTGYTTITQLPAVADLSLVHEKTIDRQERQNEFYDTI
jgi:glycosyltransferase involved in cell wall biosynthesis